MSYVLRAAAPADVAQIHGLILALAEFEQLTDLVVATEADLTRVLFSADGRVEALVAEDAAEPGQLLAFALYFHNYSTFRGRHGLYLEDLFVRPEHRGRGIARSLLQRLAAIAVARDCARFEWSVLDWNENAIRFYQRMGAQVLPDWRIVRMTGPELLALAAASEMPPD